MQVQAGKNSVSGCSSPCSPCSSCAFAVQANKLPKLFGHSNQLSNFTQIMQISLKVLPVEDGTVELWIEFCHLIAGKFIGRWTKYFWCNLSLTLWVRFSQNPEEPATWVTSEIRWLPLWSQSRRRPKTQGPSLGTPDWNCDRFTLWWCLKTTYHERSFESV